MTFAHEGRTRCFKLTLNDWRVLGYTYRDWNDRGTHVEAIWKLSQFSLAQTSIRRSLDKLRIIGLICDITDRVRTDKRLRGYVGKVGETNRIKLYTITKLGELAYESYENIKVPTTGQQRLFS